MLHSGPATCQDVSIDTNGSFGGCRWTKKYLYKKNNDFIIMVLIDQYPGKISREFKKHLKAKNILIVFTAIDAPFLMRHKQMWKKCSENHRTRRGRKLTKKNTLRSHEYK